MPAWITRQYYAHLAIPSTNTCPCLQPLLFAPHALTSAPHPLALLAQPPPLTLQIHAFTPQTEALYLHAPVFYRAFRRVSISCLYTFGAAPIALF